MEQTVIEDIVDRIVNDLDGKKEVSDESMCFAIADFDDDIKTVVETLLSRKGVSVTN